MGLASRLTLAVYALIPSMSFALLDVSGNAYLLQGVANYFFGGLNSPNLAVYLFEGVLILIFIVVGEVSILAIGRGAVSEFQED